MGDLFNEERMEHTCVTREELEGARYVICCGDPFRVPKIAAYLDNARDLQHFREYRSMIGELDGEKVVVCSHGIGGPSTAIMIEEFAMCGADTFIRVGTSGGMNLDVLSGDVVVVNAAIRAEGTSREYLPVEFPAVSDFDVTLALRDAARELAPGAWHVGIAQCKDSYYGQHNPASMPVSYLLENRWQAWIRGGALISEMETAALFTVCSTRHCRAGAVILNVCSQERAARGMDDRTEWDSEMAIKVAVRGVKNLIAAGK